MKTITKTPLVGTPNQVMDEFARRMAVSPMEIIARNKSAQISEIRHLYCKLRHDAHGVSCSEIAREIGRTFDTVKYGVNRINDMLLIGDQRVMEMWDGVKDILGNY